MHCRFIGEFRKVEFTRHEMVQVEKARKKAKPGHRVCCVLFVFKSGTANLFANGCKFCMRFQIENFNAHSTLTFKSLFLLD